VHSGAFYKGYDLSRTLGLVSRSDFIDEHLRQTWKPEHFGMSSPPRIALKTNVAGRFH